MARALPVTFSSAVVEPAPAVATFEVAAVEGTIALRGSITAVGGDWSLSAIAVRRRRTIVLYVTAKERRSAGGPRLRDYSYDALIREIAPGRYSLQVAHMYTLAGVEWPEHAVRKFERQLVVS